VTEQIQPFVYRKELAIIAQVHIKTIERNERRYGLTAKHIKKQSSSREIRYKRKAALACLRRVGLIF
jgi:hypothetical protein